MSEQKKFDACLGEKIAECNRRSRQLREDGRTDESVFENIRANVYGIFKTVLGAAERSCGADKLAKQDFFLQKIEKISKNWGISLEKAREHGDVKKMHIEEIKLEVFQEVRKMITEEGI